MESLICESFSGSFDSKTGKLYWVPNPTPKLQALVTGLQLSKNNLIALINT